MRREEGDRAPLVFVKALVHVLPLLFKLPLLYLRLKRKQNKRRKIFKKNLRASGMDSEIVKKLIGELNDISLRDILSKAGMGKLDFF